MTNLTPILNALIALCAALVTAFVIPWVKSKTTSQGRETLLAWVKIAVAAAEQLYTSTDGNEKKIYVLNFLHEKGYEISTDEVENAVESAVLELHSELYGVSKDESTTA
jgi:hypothetical protein